MNKKYKNKNLKLIISPELKELHTETPISVKNGNYPQEINTIIPKFIKFLNYQYDDDNEDSIVNKKVLSSSISPFSFWGISSAKSTLSTFPWCAITALQYILSSTEYSSVNTGVSRWMPYYKDKPKTKSNNFLFVN